MVLREGKSNHLRCFNCLTHFCARCMEVLPNSRPGEHFSGKLKAYYVILYTILYYTIL